MATTQTSSTISETSSYNYSKVSKVAMSRSEASGSHQTVDGSKPGQDSTSSALLTATNLGVIPVDADSTRQQRLAQAAQDLGFSLPLNDLCAGYDAGDGPVERWFRDDGCYSRTVIASYVSRGGGA